MKEQIDSMVVAALDAWAKSGKRSLITMSGNSMRPLFRDGSKVVVEHRSTRIRFGDIVLYRRTGSLVAHRVVRIYRKGADLLFLTKGDRALKFDSPLLREDEIVGKVVGKMKGENVVVFQAKYWTPLNFMIAVCSFAIGSLWAVIGRI